MSETLKPRLIVVAGPNGAGKTSITEQYEHETSQQSEIRNRIRPIPLMRVTI